VTPEAFPDPSSGEPSSADPTSSDPSSARSRSAPTTGHSLLRLRDIATLAPAYAIPGLASFLTVPILFAVLGATEYGRWALLYGIAAGVPQVTTSWLEARRLRFGHRFGRRADRPSLVLALLATIVTSAILTVAFVPAASALEILATAMFTTLVSLYVLLVASLQAALAFGAVSVAATIRSVLGAILGISGAMISGRAAIAIVGLALGYAAGEVLGRMLGAQQRVAHPVGSSSGDDTKFAGAVVGVDDTTGISPPPERASYGMAASATAVASYVLSVGDRFLLATLRPLSEVGAYAATYSLVDLAGRFVPSIVLGAMRPRIFRAWDRGETGELGSAAVLLAAALAWVVGLAAAAVTAAAVITRRLPVDAILVGPIALGFACFMAANTLGVAYSAATRQARLATHFGLAAATNIGLNVVLIRSQGALGAAIATAVSYAVLLLLNATALPVRWRLDVVSIGLVTSTIATIGCLILAGIAMDGHFVALAIGLALPGLPLALSGGRRLRRSGGT
jgi:O-antigen/teichoic acid export membrane protein